MPFFAELEVGKPRIKGHEHYWGVIRAIGVTGIEFTISDIVGETAGHRDSVGDFIRRLCRTSPPILEAAGYRNVRNPHWHSGATVKARTYRLLRAPVETPSLRRDGSEGVYGRKRQHMWNILRGPQGRDGLDAQELAMLAETSDLPISLATAKEFLVRLDAAGLLIVLQSAAHHRLARYRLRPNQGPKAPKLLRARLVYDPNSRAIVGPVLCEEDER